MFQKIINKSEGLSEQLQIWRRDFHRHPETGWMEMRTSSLIARSLKDMGYEEILMGRDVCLDESRMGVPSKERLDEHYKQALNDGADAEFLPFTKDGFTGVIAVLRCGEGPTVALRFDIDALPVEEAHDVSHFPYCEGFISENPGFMHACGHDGHITVGLGTAKVLMECREYLHGTVKLIFQPAEEGVRGAKSIVDHGHLDKVDYLLGAHMSGDKNTEINAIGVGINHTLATTKFDVIFHGKAAHAGLSPHLGSYAMLAAATAVLNLHAIPRCGEAATRINVGKITGGTGRNIVCDKVTLELEVRGDTTEANEYMEEAVKRVVKSAAEMHNCTYEINTAGSAKCNSNSPEFCEQILEICGQQLHMNAVRTEGFSASEDFSYMSDYVQKHGGQSCYFFNIVRCAAALHNYSFDFDEAALVNGVKAFAGITAAVMNLY